MSESGIDSRADVTRLQDAGFDAFLVGEHLMKAADPAAALRAFAVMMVKVCGITRREDAEAAVAAGASALGFVFYPHSPRYVTPERAAELGEGLDVWKVGVFVEETAASIEAVMRAARLDVAQIYGGGAPAGARVWKAFRVDRALDSRSAGDGAEAVLLDGPPTESPSTGRSRRRAQVAGGEGLIRRRRAGRLQRGRGDSRRQALGRRRQLAPGDLARREGS